MNNITYVDVDDIGVIRLSHAAKNSVTLPFSEQFKEAILAAKRSDAKAIIITGAGDSFCAGINLKEVPFYDKEQQVKFLENANRNIYELYRMSKPVVAAINGHAIGAGLIIALTSDYRVASKSLTAVYGLTEARSGIPFPACPAVALKSEMSVQDIRFLTLYSKNVDINELKKMRVVDDVVEPELVEEKAFEIAMDLAQIPADSYAAVKHQFRSEAIRAMKDIVENQLDPMISKWVSDSSDKAAESVLLSTPKVQQ